MYFLMFFPKIVIKYNKENCYIYTFISTINNIPVEIYACSMQFLITNIAL